MIVLDASVLIGYLDAGDAHHDRATALLTREIDDDFAVNLLTLAQCNRRSSTSTASVSSRTAGAS